MLAEGEVGWGARIYNLHDGDGLNQCSKFGLGLGLFNGVLSESPLTHTTNIYEWVPTNVYTEYT
jgi:hypothetical protein